MKQIKKITLLLIFLTTLVSSNLLAQASKTFQVVAVHEVELKDNVDTKEFENHVFTKIAPIYNRVEGQHFQLVKGDRGSRTNMYAFVLTFDTLEDRNRIYPEGKDSPVDWGEDEIWEKLRSMTVELFTYQNFTDYVEVGN